LSNFNSRKFFINKIGSKLIQLQPDKLLFNWKKTDVGEEYPNFSVVFEEFMKHYESLKGESDIDSRINQVEVTYLDHILLEDFEIKDFNTGAILNVLNFENRPINHFKVEYSIPVEDLRGNIRVSIHSAKRNNDLKNIIVLESTCRGALGKNSISEWFDTAHKRLTNLFDNLSTDKAKEIWEGQK
jgi:uncharacterized protein (TIGR04255 family)